MFKQATKRKTSVMLTGQALRLLAKIAADFGVSQSAALEIIIRSYRKPK